MFLIERVGYQRMTQPLTCVVPLDINSDGLLTADELAQQKFKKFPGQREALCSAIMAMADTDHVG